MASLGELEISVVANISNLSEGLNKAGAAVQEFSRVSQSAGAVIAPATRQIENMGKGLIDVSKDANVAATSIEKIKAPTSAVQTVLAKTAIEASKADSSIGKMSVGSNQAAFALTNLGRVAQDAPFGFIGIQNNLNPLLESFQRLRAETGSNSAALKALGSSLMGPAGLGIALSVVSAAILIYQKYMSSSKAETKKHEKAVKAIATTYDLFLQEIEKTSEAAGKEAAKVSILFAALGDANIGLKERKTILGQLNEISPAYLGSLDKEKASYEQISKAILEYTDSLAISAEIKALMPQVDQLFQGLIKAQIELNQLRRVGTNDKNFFGLSDVDFKAEESRLNSVIKSFTNQIKIAKTGLNFIAGGPLSLSNILFGKNPEKEHVKKVKEHVRRAYVATGPLKIRTSAEILFDLQQAQKKANDKIGTNPIIVKGIIDIDYSNKDSDNFKKAQAFAKMIEEANKSASKNVRAMWIDSFAAVGEGIGNAIGSGSNVIKAAFGGILSVIGEGLKQLGKAMIGIGTAKIAIEKFNFAPGIGTVIAGIATVALGSLLQAALPRFAVGTQNFSGGMALVGERGPELVNLPKGSGVIPNEKIGGIAGGGSVHIYGEFVQRGQNLVAVINQTTQRNSRAF